MSAQPHPIVEKTMSLMSIVTETADADAPVYLLTDAGSSAVMVELSQLNRVGRLLSWPVPAPALPDVM